MLFEVALAFQLEVEYRKYLWECGMGGPCRPWSRRHWLHWLESDPSSFYVAATKESGI